MYYPYVWHETTLINPDNWSPGFFKHWSGDPRSSYLKVPIPLDHCVGEGVGDGCSAMKGDIFFDSWYTDNVRIQGIS